MYIDDLDYAELADELRLAVMQALQTAGLSSELVVTVRADHVFVQGLAAAIAALHAVLAGDGLHVVLNNASMVARAAPSGGSSKASLLPYIVGAVVGVCILAVVIATVVVVNRRRRLMRTAVMHINDTYYAPFVYNNPAFANTARDGARPVTVVSARHGLAAESAS